MPRPKKEKPNHAGGLYEVKITVGKTMEGKLIRKSFYSSISKEDARRQAEAWKVEKEVAERTGETFVEKNITFYQWAQRWLDSIKGTVKDNTYQLTYVNSVNNHLIPYFGSANLSAIQPIDVKKFFNEKAKTHSHETLKKIRQCANSIFESAIDNNLCVRNPCRNIKLKDSLSTSHKSVYTEEQVALVLEYAKTHRFGDEIIMLLAYGLRRGELLGLRWEDVDFENKILHIRQAVADVKNVTTGKMEVVVDIPKTAYSIRDLPMSDDIADMLNSRPRTVILGRNKHKKRAGKEIDTQYIFPNQSGGVCSPRTWARRHYDVFMAEMHEYYLCQEKPIDVPMLNPHELRHTRASLWVNDNKSLFAIASVLGWGDLKMLRQRYAHSDVESNRKALGL